jgi:SMC interacting uncharacterized protein involved in chromosome segregation
MESLIKELTKSLDTKVDEIKTLKDEVAELKSNNESLQAQRDADVEKTVAVEEKNAEMIEVLTREVDDSKIDISALRAGNHEKDEEILRHALSLLKQQVFNFCST